jgi:hypothetical protein
LPCSTTAGSSEDPGISVAPLLGVVPLLVALLAARDGAEAGGCHRRDEVRPLEAQVRHVCHAVAGVVANVCRAYVCRAYQADGSDSWIPNTSHIRGYCPTLACARACAYMCMCMCMCMCVCMCMCPYVHVPVVLLLFGGGSEHRPGRGGPAEICNVVREVATRLLLIVWFWFWAILKTSPNKLPEMEGEFTSSPCVGEYIQPRFT